MESSPTKLVYLVIESQIVVGLTMKTLSIFCGELDELDAAAGCWRLSTWKRHSTQSACMGCWSSSLAAPSVSWSVIEGEASSASLRLVLAIYWFDDGLHQRLECLLVDGNGESRLNTRRRGFRNYEGSRNRSRSIG